jgi:hypothetical protein
MSSFDEALAEIKKTKEILNEPVTQESKHPDPKKHLYVSLVKSVVRIGAGGCLIMGNLFFAGFLLIFAEALGVVEELV